MLAGLPLKAETTKSERVQAARSAWSDCALAIGSILSAPTGAGAKAQKQGSQWRARRPSVVQRHMRRRGDEDIQRRAIFSLGSSSSPTGESTTRPVRPDMSGLHLLEPAHHICCCLSKSPLSPT